jgi:hypothetical protein
MRIEPLVLRRKQKKVDEGRAEERGDANIGGPTTARAIALIDA